MVDAVRSLERNPVSRARVSHRRRRSGRPRCKDKGVSQSDHRPSSESSSQSIQLLNCRKESSWTDTRPSAPTSYSTMLTGVNSSVIISLRQNGIAFLGVFRSDGSSDRTSAYRSMTAWRCSPFSTGQKTRYTVFHCIVVLVAAIAREINSQASVATLETFNSCRPSTSIPLLCIRRQI